MDIVRIGKSALLISTTALVLSAATVCVQVSLQLRRTPGLALKAEATLDYAGRAAKHLDEASRVWADASAVQAEYLHTTLPSVTAQAQSALTDSDALLRSLRQQTEQISGSADSAVKQVTATTATLQDAVKSTDGNVQQVLQHVDALAADGHLQSSLAHIDQTTAEAARSLETTNEILADVRDTADRYKKRRPWFLRMFGF